MIVAYGAGLWTLKNKMEKPEKYMSSIRKWLLKNKNELKNNCKFICPNNVPGITVRRLESVRHVVRQGVCGGAVG
jgi:hypothetical protein